MFLLEEVVEVTDQKDPRTGARDSLQLLQQIAEASCDGPSRGREPLGHQIFDHIQHRMLASLGSRVVQQFVPSTAPPIRSPACRPDHSARAPTWAAITDLKQRLAPNFMGER
ncbi:MAG: hypothetical protein CM15mP103_04670 [Gammaproteobacteria bacterium]|nr:MAG: hypothetical protein CM15mP103_04670 [Gammaproteobacteria bacterium]